MTFYCIDCKKRFDDKELYFEHCKEKNICPRCLKQFKTSRSLNTHMDSKRRTKCDDNCSSFVAQIEMQKQMNTMEKQTRETDGSVDELKRKIKELEEVVRTYKVHGLKALEAVEKHSVRTTTESLPDTLKEDTRALTLHHKYAPTSNVSGHTGYTTEAWKSMLTGNNEDVLLTAEFGTKEIDKMNNNVVETEKILTEETDGTRREHSSMSHGYISSKFNQTLEYEVDDLDDAGGSTIESHSDNFDEILHMQNANIARRRQHHLGDNMFDLDYDIFAAGQAQHLAIID